MYQQVEASPSRNNGDVASGKEVVGCCAGVAEEVPGGVILRRVQDVNQVVRHRAPLRRRGLGGADVEAAVDLDFASEDADCSAFVLPLANHASPAAHRSAFVLLAGRLRLTHRPYTPTLPRPCSFGLCFRVRSGDFRAKDGGKGMRIEDGLTEERMESIEDRSG
ncbi:hypothetical protein E2562_033167 [Oryza meyeriana var. granulata]|uniref:Uncharacterized protein n=1 Tax=Oryza meyeriana var. granulata TaxID=110450 RepID=A0A6G1DRE7_9ORYZ|nr:hypothetical protein E2562_033167 [Oryza meyeriana var. granulata]